MHCEIPLNIQNFQIQYPDFIVGIGWHELMRWKKWTWDDKFSHTAEKPWPAETSSELTHSHQWNEKNGKIENEVTNWAHLLPCDSKQIYIIGFTMHNVNSLTFTWYVQNIHRSTRLEFDWLEWVAPDSTSTISAISMTYSTLASLVRADWGVFFIFLFLLGCAWPSWSTHGHPWNPDWYPGAKPEASNISFLASSFASYSFLPFRSCSSFSISPLTTDLKSCTCLHIFSHSFSALPASCARWSHWWHRSCMSSTTSSACVMKVVAMAEQRGPPKATGEGDWPGFRKGIGTRRGSLMNLGKNLSFLSLSHLPLTGTLVLVTPIEPHGDFKLIRAFYGGYGIRL